MGKLLASLHSLKMWGSSVGQCVRLLGVTLYFDLRVSILLFESGIVDWKKDDRVTRKLLEPSPNHPSWQSSC